MTEVFLSPQSSTWTQHRYKKSCPGSATSSPHPRPPPTLPDPRQEIIEATQRRPKSDHRATAHHVQRTSQRPIKPVHTEWTSNARTRYQWHLSTDPKCKGRASKLIGLSHQACQKSSQNLNTAPFDVSCTALHTSEYHVMWNSYVEKIIMLSCWNHRNDVSHFFDKGHLHERVGGGKSE